MLSPDTRTVAFELLCPPSGYELDFALLTTYTLDLEVMLALPLSLLAHSEEGIEELLTDPLLLLEALRQAGDRIHVFVDQTGIAIPQSQRELYAMLESSVHQVRAPGGGSFHPKIWLLRFSSKDQSPLLRVAVLSRNLTFDRSWDIALVSEGSPKPKQGVRASLQLSQFIGQLPELCISSKSASVKPEYADRVSDLADEVRRTPFPAPDDFFEKPIVFHVLGLKRSRSPWSPIDHADRSLAIAPFVNRKALDSIGMLGEEKGILVSRQDSLDKLHEEALEGWSSVLTLDDAATDEPEDANSHRPSGLHAKILVLEHGWNVSWFVGSANMTAAAFTGRNVEVMASMTARKGRAGGNSGQGIDRFLESGFGNLCVPYRRNDEEAEGIEADEARKRLEQARCVLLQADLSVTCQPLADNWNLRLEGTVTLPENDVTVSAWPISVNEEQAQSLALPLDWTLPVQRLTSLVAFRLQVTPDEVDDIAFTLMLPTDGMPSDRLHHILRNLIGDTERFLAFLRALLGGLDQLSGLKRAKRRKGGAPNKDEGNEEILLEDLVRTASREPERLQPIRRLMEDFLKTEQGRQIVPNQFLEIWTAVDQAIKSQHRS